MPSEKRKGGRASALLAAKISLDRPGSAPLAELAPVLNISEDGALLETRNRYPTREFVKVEIADLKLRGQATIRYSDAKGAKYRTGLEFSGGLKFKAPPPDAL
jgi:hypothetical protein